MNRVSFADLVNARPLKPVEKTEEPRPEPRNLGPSFLGSEEPRNLGKQGARVRGKQLNVEINPLSLQALKQYALDNGITLIEAVERAIFCLVSEEPRNLGHDDDRDHDFKKKIDHHPRRSKAPERYDHPVAQEYERLTGNQWRRTDERAFAKVSELPATRVIELMRTIYERSQSHPANFSYFVVGIFKELAAPSSAPNKTAPGLKTKYQAYLKEIYATYTGANLSVSDVIFHLKRRCARDNTAWNDDVANDVLKVA